MILAAIAFFAFYAVAIALVFAGAAVILSLIQNSGSLEERIGATKKMFIERGSDFRRLIRTPAA